MLKSYSNSPSSARQQAAVSLRTFGWIGFWTQLILTVGSGLVLLFAIADPNLNINREQRDFVKTNAIATRILK